jgi:UDP-glucuronate 4-epimerase
MVYLVTGGAGFIGSHLVERLLAEGNRVIVLDNFDDFYAPALKRRNLARALEHPDFRLVEGDIRDMALVTKILREEKVEGVAHLAARPGVRPSIRDPLLYAELNICGTISLLEACRQCGVHRVLFASSSSVYGKNIKVPFGEGDPTNHPISPYAATKKTGELFGYTYHSLYGLDIVCLRYFTVYGPRQRPEMAIHQFTRRIHEGKEISLFGDGSSERDYTYIDDAIEGTVRALGQDHGFEIYNIGGSRTVSLSRLIRLIEEKVGEKAQVKHQPMPPGDIPRTFADIRKAREALQYSPKVGIEEGLSRFIRWYRKEGDRIDDKGVGHAKS